jgi:DNA-binding CsgD family transcriptional regulator
MTLATADLLDLVNVIAQIYEPSTEPLIERPGVMSRLGELLHADCVGHANWNPLSSRFAEAKQWGRDARIACDYENHFQQVDPVGPMLWGLRRPIPSDALIDRTSFYKTEYFTDFLSKHRIFSYIDFFLHDAGPTRFDYRYRFATSDSKKCFGEREVTLLNLLRPHFVNEYQLRRVERLRRWAKSGVGSHASFAVRRSARPAPNGSAATMMAGLAHRERDELDAILTSISFGEAVPHQWNGFDVCVEIAKEDNDGWHPCQVHLLANASDSNAWLQQRFGLTQRERDVCKLLLEGMSDKMIAKVLNVSYWTVRIHVGKILDKLGVDSRTAVASTVFAMRAGLS